MRWITGLALATILGWMPVGQDIGAWEIIYASDDELLLMLPAAEYRGDSRPIIHLHCKAGIARVFFRPYAETVRLQFDDGELVLGRFTGHTYGFAIDSTGQLVEETLDTGHIPMRHFAKSGELVAEMAQHQRLYVRAQGRTVGAAAINPERNHFELAGLDLIFRELGNPCVAG